MGKAATTGAPRKKSFFRGEALRTFKAKGAASYGHSGDSGARAKEQRRHDHGAGIQAGAWATATHPARECGRAGRSAQGSRAPHAAKVRREVVSIMPCLVIESRDDQEMKSHRGAIAEVARHNRGAYKRSMRNVQRKDRRGAAHAFRADFSKEGGKQWR